MRYEKGQRVRVMLPTNDPVGVDTVKQFQGKVTVVKDVRIYRKKTSLLGRSYTLLGCKTDWGIDYEFCEEWLVPMDEEVAV